VVPFKGERSSVQQFNRALSADEIGELMQKTPAIAVTKTPARVGQEAVKRRAAAPLRLSTNAGAASLTAWAIEPGRYEMVRADGRVLVTAVDAVPPPLAVAGGWTLRFPVEWGAPAEVELPVLGSWTQHSDPGVKYFSGTATYTKTVDVPNGFLGKQRQISLDLGDVQVIAGVKLNGRDLGVLWKPPFRLDITDSLREGRNDLEIKVTNLWVNRLIGDEQLPTDREWTKVPHRGGLALKTYPDWFQRGERSPIGRITFTTWKHYEKDAPLLSSGLLGPVTIRSAVKVDWEMKP
jgi:hypothetical protein